MRAPLFPWLALLLLLAGCRPKSEQSNDYVVNPAECAQRQKWFVITAVRHGSEIWVLDSAARLWSISADTSVFTRRLSSDEVAGLAVIGDTLVALAFRDGKARLATHAHAAWGRSIALAGDPIGLVASKDEVVILARDRASVLSASTLDRLREVAIEPSLTMRLGYLPRRSGNTIYLVEHDEERSSLYALDLTNGRSQLVESRTHAMCSGLLDSRCDIIRSVAADPVHDGCVVVSVRPNHHDASRSLLRVCGTTVTRVVTTAPELAELAVINGRICGAQGDDLVCIDESGAFETRPLPAPREVCGLPVRQGEGMHAVGRPLRFALPGNTAHP